MNCGELEKVTQNWKGMDGATAWHLIDRHAEGWSEVGRMMQEWLDANSATAERDELLAALKSISKITGEAKFNIGGPLEHCEGELEHDKAKRLLSLACEYLKDTSKAAHRVIASVKGGAA